MSNILREILDLKTDAKFSKKNGQVEEAEKTLNEGIVKLEAALERAQDPRLPAGDWERRIVSELADFWGILGGTRRGTGDLSGAAQAYDRGFQYESDPRYGFANSFNALNRLVVRILWCPDALSDPEALTRQGDPNPLNVPDALTILAKEIQAQVNGMRSQDLWAVGDLLLVGLLIQDTDLTRDAWSRLEELNPPQYACQAYASTMEELAAREIPCKDELKTAVERLQQLGN
jgi:hypothetical protein